MEKMKQVQVEGILQPEENELTRHSGTCLEGFCNLGVELDHHIPGVRDLLMTGIDLFIHPVGERLSDLCMDDIRYILAGQLQNLTFYSWQGFCNYSVTCTEGQHVFYGKAAVLGDHNMHHICPFDSPFLARGQISQMPDGDILIGR